MYDYDSDNEDLLGYGLDEEDLLGYADEMLGYGLTEEDLLGFGLGDIGRALKKYGGKALGGAARAVLPGAIERAVGLRRRAPARGRTPFRTLMPGRPMTRVVAKPPLISPAPGVPQTSGLYIPLGLGSFDFTNAAGLSARVFTGNPQKPVRPRRLWINAAKSAGAAGIGVTVTDIKIGTKSMLAGVDAIPVEQFAANAFAKSYSMFDSATPGVFVSVSLALSAVPGAGENVFVSMSMDCDSLG